MIRNLKAFGLALVAAFALSAVVASAASAEFTTGSDETTLTAKSIGEQTFKIENTPGENSTATCTEVEVHGGPFGTVQTEITVEPTYKGHCTVSLEGLNEGKPLEAEIKTNGCHYLFTTEEAVGVHVLCPVGAAIEIKPKILGSFRKCLNVHGQTPTSPVVHYRNGTDPSTGKMDVEIESTVSGITWEKVGGCAFGTTEGNDASYAGRVTVTGDGPSGPVDVTHSLFP